MKSSVTISSKRQITIPIEIFRFLELKEGQKLLVEVEDDRIVMKPRPESMTKALMGSTRGLYGQKATEVDNYVEKEREAWQK
jgi:antitoxin ChpS